MNGHVQNLGRRDGQSAERRRGGPGAVGGRLPKPAYPVAKARGILGWPYLIRPGIDLLVAELRFCDSSRP